MNFASLLGGGGLQSQINPLAGVLGGSSGLLGTSGVPNELADLCALLATNKANMCLWQTCKSWSYKGLGDLNLNRRSV